MPDLFFTPWVLITSLVALWMIAALLLMSINPANRWPRQIFQCTIGLAVLSASFLFWSSAESWAKETYASKTVAQVTNEMVPLRDSLSPDAPEQAFLVEQTTDGTEQYVYMTPHYDSYQMQTVKQDEVKVVVTNERQPRYVTYESIWVDERGSFYASPPEPEHDAVIYVPENGTITNGDVSLDF